MPLHVDEFVWRLRQHEAEIRRRMGHMGVVYLLKTGSHEEFPLFDDQEKPLFKWRLGGKLLGYSRRTVRYIRSSEFGPCFDIGGPSFPFALVWFEFSSLSRHESMPSIEEIQEAHDEIQAAMQETFGDEIPCIILDDGIVYETPPELETGQAELFCWYWDESGDGIGHDDDLFVIRPDDWANVGYSGLDTHVSREMRYTLHHAPSDVIKRVGDLSILPRWTDALLYLAARPAGIYERLLHPHLLTFPKCWDKRPGESGGETIDDILFSNPTDHIWLVMPPHNFAAATSYAFETLKHIATSPGASVNTADPPKNGGGDVADYPTPENYERDKWIYEQRGAGQTYPEIQVELDRFAQDKKFLWGSLEVDGMREAMKRYARYAKLPPQKGKPGRPKKQG